jgi:hypothetical protein
MQRGTLVTVRDGVGDVNEDDAEAAQPPRPLPKTDAVVFERFNLHASVSLAADDDLGRERLCRYLSRPPFALGRIRVLRDGNVAYRVKKVSRHRTTERVMTPLEFLARLASLVAPPRFPLLRLHGVFGARHRWRARIVPKPPAATFRKSSTSCGGALEHRRDADARSGALGPDVEQGTRPSPPRPDFAPRAVDGEAALAIPVRQALPTSSLLTSGLADVIAPNILSLAHWQRLDQGELYAASSRVDWISLFHARSRSTFASVVVAVDGFPCAPSSPSPSSSRDSSPSSVAPAIHRPQPQQPTTLWPHARLRSPRHGTHLPAVRD